MKHIGIVGCSAEGAALCYRTICERDAHPEVTLHTLPLADYVKRIDAGDWRGVGELMLRSAQALHRAGAEFLICPDNTIHQALPFIEARSPLPWLHIAKVVAESAAARGFHRPGLTGTKWLVESDVYPREWLRPSEPDRLELNRIIMEELVHGIFRPEAVMTFQRVMTGFAHEGCDAVVLGCTEIPLLMNERNSPLPVLDSTRLLARAALHFAAG